MSAIISTCGRYRYRLERELGQTVRAGAHQRGTVAFVMLNPSTADATVDDPTIRRCTGYARSWGFSRLVVGNAYAWRSTDPAGLWTAPDPVGPENDAHLSAIARDAELVVCAWGSKIAPARQLDVIEILRLRSLAVLGLTKGGFPCHPLYLRKDLRPSAWIQAHYACGECGVVGGHDPTCDSDAAWEET